MSMIPKHLMSEEDIKLQFITPAITTKWDISKITMETQSREYANARSLKSNPGHCTYSGPNRLRD